jgi:hypothetical protein
MLSYQSCRPPFLRQHMWRTACRSTWSFKTADQRTSCEERHTSEKIEATFHEANSYRRHVTIYGLPSMGKSKLMYYYVRGHQTKYLAVFAADASKLENVGAAFNEPSEELKLPRCYEDDQSQSQYVVFHSTPFTR